jgi:hypothetical protein
LAGATTFWCWPRVRLNSHIITSRSESANGSARSISAWTTEKMAVFAPMPKASASTATAVKPGLFQSTRTA